MNGAQKKLLENSFEDVRVFSRAMDLQNINEVLDSDILVSRPRGMKLNFNRATLSKFKNLKYICVMSTGFDHIDLDYCKEKGIIVSNVPSYSESSVAEQTFALILAISRKIPSSVRLKKDEFNLDKIKGFDLHGKILGVIGSGKIGLEVIKIAKGFGMKVLAYDVVFNDVARRELDYEYVSLDDLLRSSDIVSIHAPYNKHTYHMLNKDNLAIIKKGVVLINTSRGELIESKALLDNLKTSRISFAGLDVLEKGFKFNKNLMKMRNVLITPHNASNTVESKKKVFDETLENMRSFINGEMRNII